MKTMKFLYKKYYFSLFVCLLLALLVRVLIAEFLPAPWRADEVFQYMEPAHRLLDGHGVITWEWRVGIRSWLIPGVIAALMKLGIFLGETNLIFFVRVCFSLFSLSLVGAFFWYGWRRGGLFLAWMLGLTAALWPDIASGGMRTLGEFIAGNLMGLAAVCIVAYREENSPRASTILASSAGLFLGSAASVRFQIAPASVFGFLFLFRKNNLKQAAISLFCFSIPVFVLGLCDAITLGKVFQSVFRNYYYNQTLGVADTFGKKYFFYYIEKYAKLWGGFFVLILFFSMKAKREKFILLPISVFVIAYHSLISHKEVSFIYPAIPPLVLCAALGFYQTLRNADQCKNKYLLIVSSSMLCIFFSSYAPFLHLKGQGIAFERWASKQQDVCGIASLGYDGGSFFSNLGGGYSVLKKITPIYLFDSAVEAQNAQGKFNYLITSDSQHVWGKTGNWIQVKCVDNSACLYHRPGKCLEAPDFEQSSNKLEMLNK